GSGCNNGGNGAFSSHHIWVLNNVISGQGASGIQTETGDYIYVIHNKFVGNANNSACLYSAQGSGLSLSGSADISWGYAGYTPTTDDQINPTFGSWQVGAKFFHDVIEWNGFTNNYVQGCGTG